MSFGLNISVELNVRSVTPTNKVASKSLISIIALSSSGSNLQQCSWVHCIVVYEIKGIASYLRSKSSLHILRPPNETQEPTYNFVLRDNKCGGLVADNFNLIFGPDIPVSIFENLNFETLLRPCTSFELQIL